MLIANCKGLHRTGHTACGHLFGADFELTRLRLR